MSTWSEKTVDWQKAVIVTRRQTRSLALMGQEEDRFEELDRSKTIAIDCAREVLDITGGNL